jgi:hypothetical protein
MILTCDATYRYFWIHVDDIDNSDGYIEIGKAFLGTASVLTEGLGDALNTRDIDPSTIVMTPEGAVGKNEKTKYFEADINLNYMNSTDRDTLRTIYDDVGSYGHMFIRLDPDESTFSHAELGGIYGYIVGNMEFGARLLPTIRYRSSMLIREAR